jgi:hypothetical protein
MRGRMGGMTQPNKAQLLSELADNAVQIQQSAERILGRINNEEWQKALDQIVEMRNAQKELESELRALANNPPSAH